MNILISIFRKLNTFSTSHSYSRAVTFLFAMAVAGAFFMHFIERGVNEQFATIGDSLWWAVATITTVGYGDKCPVTSTGRLVAALVMFGGIGSFGFIAGSMLEELIKRGQGRMGVRFEDHFVICSHNYKVESIVQEIKKELGDCKVVLIADREENPLAHRDGVHFIRGDGTKEAVLKMAGISKANTVIVMADSQMDEHMADAHSVLTILAVKHLNPSCKIVAESLNPENNDHLIRAGADEIICIGDVTAKLISRSSIHVGITQLISELMTNDAGNELYSANLPDRLVNCRFEEAFSDLRRLGGILIGIYQGGRLLCNPPPETVLNREVFLVYIAEDRLL